MEDPPIAIHVSQEQASTFNTKVHELFYSTRAGYDECLMRHNVLCLVNDIWQTYLIEKEENSMINKSNSKYGSIITDETSIEIETIENKNNSKNKPYKKCIGTKSENKNIWCTPIEGQQKVIIIREYENGPIIRKIIIPSVMIFGSIAFGLDGIASDIDLALPAGIYNQSVNAHLDTSRQVKLLREFQGRLQLYSSKSHKAGFKWKIEPILHARVPIIKLTDIKRGICVDISIRSTQMPITKLLNYYRNYDAEKVTFFFLFVKQWSKIRHISDAVHGFPNSFGFVMLVTKFLQLLQEPIIPILIYDRNKKKLIERHSIKKFKNNAQSLLELAVSFFDYYFNFDFETYQISITTAGLQWKHAEDYNLNHDDQSTMLIEDPSSKNENVTRCLKPCNLKILRSEFFRAYKCAKNGDWELLFQPFDEYGGEDSIFNKYPPTDKREEEIRYEIEQYDDYDEYDDHEYQEEYEKKRQQKKYYKKNTKKNNQNSKNHKKYIKKKQQFYRNNNQ